MRINVRISLDITDNQGVVHDLSLYVPYETSGDNPEFATATAVSALQRTIEAFSLKLVGTLGGDPDARPEGGLGLRLRKPR